MFKSIIILIVGIFVGVGASSLIVNGYSAPEKVEVEKKALVNVGKTTKMFEEVTEKYQDLLTGFWSHDNSDGCDFECRIKDRVGRGWYGENLYRGTCDLVNAVNMWLESPTHKAVLDYNYSQGVLLIKPGQNDGECFIVLHVAD